MTMHHSVSTVYPTMDTSAFLASLLQYHKEQVLERFAPPCQAREEIPFVPQPVRTPDFVETVVAEIYTSLRPYALLLASYDVAKRACLSDEDLLQIAAFAVWNGCHAQDIQQARKYARLRGRGAMVDALRSAKRKTDNNVSMDGLMEAGMMF